MTGVGGTVKFLVGMRVRTHYRQHHHSQASVSADGFGQ